MHHAELSAQHEQLDEVLQEIEEGFVAMRDRDGDFDVDRKRVVGALSSMVEHLGTHLALEEQTALTLMATEMSASSTENSSHRRERATPSRARISDSRGSRSTPRRITARRGSLGAAVVDRVHNETGVATGDSTARSFLRAEGGRPSKLDAYRAFGHLDLVDPVGLDSRASEGPVRRGIMHYDPRRRSRSPMWEGIETTRRFRFAISSAPTSNVDDGRITGCG